MTVTLSPRSTAAIAWERPAIPAPTTRMSDVRVLLIPGTLARDTPCSKPIARRSTTRRPMFTVRMPGAAMLGS